MKNLLIVLALFSSSVFASVSTPLPQKHDDRTGFSDEQMYVLQYAFAYGNQFDLNGKLIDNTKHVPQEQRLGYIMSAIAWKESGAGLNTGRNKPNHPAYGVFQNYLPTVKSKIKQRNLSYTQDELLVELETLDGSAKWSIDELSAWLKYHKGDIRKAVASYYAGFNVSKGMSYSNNVLAKAKILEQHINLVE